MNKLTMNPNNKRYYSEKYIKGWEDGVKAQYEVRPKGKWILECDSGGEGSNLYYCSECGCDYSCQEYDKPNFCPDCGAYMKSEVM